VAKIGEVVEIKISSGHKFPEGEHAPKSERIKAYVQDASGNKTSLSFVTAHKSLQAPYKVTVDGLHVIYFEVDRGVISRTPKGWQQGGKKQHPKAIQSMNFYTSAFAYMQTTPDAIKETQPIGLKLELTFKMEKEQVIFSSYHNLAPIANVKIFMLRSGEKKSKEIGTTDAKGKFTYSRKDLATGSVMFIAQYRNKAAKDADYNLDLFRSILFLNL
jgi:uncharacterized GH25 family protein